MKCESCDIELTVVPLWREDSCFCCSGCADGGPCICSYVDDPARLGSDSSEPAGVGELLDRYDAPARHGWVQALKEIWNSQ